MTTIVCTSTGRERSGYSVGGKRGAELRVKEQIRFSRCFGAHVGTLVGFAGPPRSAFLIESSSGAGFFEKVGEKKFSLLFLLCFLLFSVHPIL